MNPYRRVPLVAWVAMMLVALAVAPARAQFFDDIRRDLDIGPDQLTRSPRLVGMGKLSLVVDDVHHRFDIWEFSQNPAALRVSDSVSTFEFYPNSASTSTVHDEPGGSTGTRERQDFAMHSMTAGFEAWRRSPVGAAFGVIGEFNQLRTDVPQSNTAEDRTQFSVPRASLVISSKMPGRLLDKLNYGIAIDYNYESQDDERKAIVSNAAGDYIDKDGTALPALEAIAPTDYKIKSLGGRFGLHYKAAPWMNLAGGYDYIKHEIEGRNDAVKNVNEVTEDRTYRTLSASASGLVATHLVFVADYRNWSTGKTDQHWASSFSTGTSSPPITGRGLYQRRTETGNQTRGRASWIQGPLTLSAGGLSFSRDFQTDVPPVDDRTSFNYFINSLSGRPAADSLMLPDSLKSDSATEEGSDYGVGASYRLPWRKSVAGVEYHAAKRSLDQLLAGAGPDYKAWDVRSGLEVPLNPQLVVRGGYIYRWVDRDENLAQNEYLYHSMTAGFSYQPQRATWQLESALQLRWGRADFGDPTRIRTDDQLALLRLRWVF